MAKWYYGWELLQKPRNWTPTELLNHIKAGLPAYDDEIDRRIFDRDTLPRHKKTIEEITDEMQKKFLLCDPPHPPTGLIEHAFKNQVGTPIYPKDGSEVMSFTLPTGKIEVLKLFDKIKLFRFKHQDVIDHESNHGLTVEEKAPLPAVAPDISTPPVKTSAINFFTKESAIWHIGFGGKDVRLKHIDGLRYIAYLLEKPETSISCSALYCGKTPDRIISEGAAIEEDLSIGGSKQKVGNAETRKICVEKYQELQEKFAGAGLEEQEEIQKQMDALEPYLNLKERLFTDPNDKKVQANIRKRLNKAYQAISQANMKELTKHLKTYIEPDGAFGLIYTGTINWEITIK